MQTTLHRQSSSTHWQSYEQESERLPQTGLVSLAEMQLVSKVCPVLLHAGTVTCPPCALSLEAVRLQPQADQAVS